MTQTEIDPLDGEIHIEIAKPHNLNVTLSGELHLKLDRLAKTQGLTKSIVIRRLIDYGYQMGVQQIALCASGGRCYVPNMHPPPQTSPHQNLMPGPAPDRNAAP